MTKATNTFIQQQALAELFEYNPATGIFTRRVARGRVRAGALAGWLSDSGHRMIEIDHVAYLAHRLAWLYVHGSYPSSDLDHINGIPDDNRIENLREATHGQNMQNYRAANANSKTGLLGVCYNKRAAAFVAQIRVSGKSLHLGYFKTAQEASVAYLNAKKLHHPFQTIA